MWTVILICQSSDGFRFADHDGFLATNTNDVNIKDWHFQKEVAETTEPNEIVEPMNNTVEFLSNVLVKRNNYHSCSCPTRKVREDFGQNTFPRFIYATTCDWDRIKKDGTMCHFQASCKEFKHNIYLLKFKNNHQEQHQQEIPSSIKKNFYWATQVSLSLKADILLKYI